MADLNFHRNTVYHDAVFHRAMTLRFGESWKTWEYKKVKEYAKSWNFQKLYSNMTQITNKNFLSFTE